MNRALESISEKKQSVLLLLFSAKISRMLLQTSVYLDPIREAVKSLQIFFEYEQLKYRCSRVSKWPEHKTQWASVCGLHLWTRAPVAKRSWTASHVITEYLGVAPRNHTALNQWTRGVCSLVSCHVWCVSNLGLNKSPTPLHSLISVSEFRPCSLSFSISFSISTSWTTLCMRLRYLWTATSTVAVIGIPRSIHPREPVISIIRPSCDHVSYQNDVCVPLLISTLVKSQARFLNFRIFFQIQEPKLLFSFVCHKEPFRIK